MVLNTLKCNHLTPLGLKGLTLYFNRFRNSEMSDFSKIVLLTDKINVPNTTSC